MASLARNTFSAGGAIIASEMNSNFTNVENLINDVLDGTESHSNFTSTGTASLATVTATGTVTAGAFSTTGTATAATFVGALTGNVNGNVTGSSGSCTGNASTATTWASDLTVSLGTDLSGSVTFNGDEGTVTLNATVANDSHTHDTRYYTETESDARFLGIAAKAADSDKLDNLDSTQFLRSDQSDTLVGQFSIDNDASAVNSWSLYVDGNHGTGSVTVGYGNATLVISDAGDYPSLSWRSANLGYATVMRLSTAAANKLVLRNAADSGWGDLQLGTLTESSDLTLKTKTGEVPGLDFVGRLSPFKGHWTGGEENVNFWLGAQEVSSALTAAGFDADACTLVDSSEDLMGLQYTQLIPVLVKAVQELTARLEAVEAA